MAMFQSLLWTFSKALHALHVPVHAFGCISRLQWTLACALMCSLVHFVHECAVCCVWACMPQQVTSKQQEIHTWVFFLDVTVRQSRDVHPAFIRIFGRGFAFGIRGLCWGLCWEPPSGGGRELGFETDVIHYVRCTVLCGKGRGNFSN